MENKKIIEQIDDYKKIFKNHEIEFKKIDDAQMEINFKNPIDSFCALKILISSSNIIIVAVEGFAIYRLIWKHDIILDNFSKNAHGYIDNKTTINYEFSAMYEAEIRRMLCYLNINEKFNIKVNDIEVLYLERCFERPYDVGKALTPPVYYYLAALKTINEKLISDSLEVKNNKKQKKTLNELISAINLKIFYISNITIVFCMIALFIIDYEFPLLRNSITTGLAYSGIVYSCGLFMISFSIIVFQDMFKGVFKKKK